MRMRNIEETLERIDAIPTPPEHEVLEQPRPTLEGFASQSHTTHTPVRDSGFFSRLSTDATWHTMYASRPDAVSKDKYQLERDRLVKQVEEHEHTIATLRDENTSLRNTIATLQAQLSGVLTLTNLSKE